MQTLWLLDSSSNKFCSLGDTETKKISFLGAHFCLFAFVPLRLCLAHWLCCICQYSFYCYQMCYHPNQTIHLHLHASLKILNQITTVLHRSFRKWVMIAFFPVPKQEEGVGKACSEGQQCDMQSICVGGIRNSRVIYSSARLDSLHFHQAASVYIYPGMNKLSDSQYITIERGVSNCRKADGLTLLSISDKKNNKKSLAYRHIPIGSNPVRFHQPGKFGYDDWPVIEFFKEKKNQTIQHTLYIFCTSRVTSAYHKKKEEFTPCWSFFLIPIQPQLC